MCYGAGDYAPWTRANTAISFSAFSSRQHYTEFDEHALTSGGVLDTERGRLPGYAVGVRWQDTVGLIPVFLSAGLSRAKGHTRYGGHMMAFGTLTPYHATTANRHTEIEATAGLPIALGQQMQLIPMIGLTRHRWLRVLEQYQEMTDHTTLEGSLIVQARKSRLMLEASLGLVTPLSARTTVMPAQVRLQARRERGARASVMASYALDDHWIAGAHLHYTHQRWGPSVAVQQLQLPPSRATAIAAGVHLALLY